MREQEHDVATELYDRLWKSKSARFNASHRMTKTHILSSYSTNFLSVYVIILSIVPAFDIFSNSNNVKFLNLGAVCVSITLLVFVLIESSMGYNLKAEKFHDCAKKIGKLFKKMEFITNDTTKNDSEKFQKLIKIQDKYDKIIDLYENHRPIDYSYFQAINKLKNFSKNTTKVFGFEISVGNFGRWYTLLKYNHLIYIHYYFVIFILPLSIAYYIFIT